MHVALIISELAFCAEKQNKFAQSETLYKRCLDILESNLDPKHQVIARILERYSEVLRKTGREQEADAMQERVNSIWGAQKQDLWFGAES